MYFHPRASGHREAVHVRTTTCISTAATHITQQTREIPLGQGQRCRLGYKDMQKTRPRNPPNERPRLSPLSPRHQWRKKESHRQTTVREHARGDRGTTPSLRRSVRPRAADANKIGQCGCRRRLAPPPPPGRHRQPVRTCVLRLNSMSRANQTGAREGRIGSRTHLSDDERAGPRLLTSISVQTGLVI